MENMLRGRKKLVKQHKCPRMLIVREQLNDRLCCQQLFQRSARFNKSNMASSSTVNVVIVNS
jgi:hypothetical protein